MIWIQGNGLEVDYGHEDDISRITMQDALIMVSFNFRFGIFEFLGLDHPAAIGNYGLWDQKLAHTVSPACVIFWTPVGYDIHRWKF